LGIIGFQDASTPVVSGWAWDSGSPGARLCIEIRIDGEPLVQVIAQEYREDLKQAGIGDGRHGYRYPLSSAVDTRLHGVSVFVVDTDFQLPRVLDRIDHLTKFITRDKFGIEIGGFHNPIAPKRLGYNCISLDVQDLAALRQKADKYDAIPRESLANIEEVDLVGSAVSISELVAARFPLGSFDYIVSSHNLEHVPDPVRFLKGCEKVLKPGGTLSMAIPDFRTCFDYFRPHSTLADLLEAYFERRNRPTPFQLFESYSLNSQYVAGDRHLIQFSIDDDPADIRPTGDLHVLFPQLQGLMEQPDAVYRDVHCWAFTPASFEMLVRDLRFIEFIQLDLLELSAPPRSPEFYVHLANRGPSADQSTLPSPAEFYEQRRILLHRIKDEVAENSTVAFAQRERLKQQEHRISELESALQISQKRVSELGKTLK